jgi:L-threonylcarbamoyladenylate synthase
MPKTIVLPADQSEAIIQAVEVLTGAGTVVFPTDTVYGLAANAFSTDAIEKLFQIKERERGKPIAVLLGSTEQLKKITSSLNSEARDLAAKHWPGALTLVVPRHPNLPENLSPLPTVGVRIPDHPAALALLKVAGPLAVTSANLSGEPNTITAEEVLQQLDGRIDLVLDGGPTPGGTPSTVVDLTGPKPVVLREGPVQILSAGTKL